jgi:hypothetical protein
MKQTISVLEWQLSSLDKAEKISIDELKKHHRKGRKRLKELNEGLRAIDEVKRACKYSSKNVKVPKYMLDAEVNFEAEKKE